jgi:transposase
VRPSFVPPKEIRELRDLTRYRKTQIEERSKEVQRLEKVLQDAGIKLSWVATRVLGASGRAMLDALVSGTTDPEVLADLWQRLACGLRYPRLGKPSKAISLITTLSWLEGYSLTSTIWTSP